MGKKRRREAVTAPAAPRAGETPALVRLLGGRPRVGEIVALLAIVLVIGGSAGYLVYRFAGSSAVPGPPPADAATAWQARLAQAPNDAEALLGLAHVRLDQQQL